MNDTIIATSKTGFSELKDLFIHLGKNQEGKCTNSYFSIDSSRLLKEDTQFSKDFELFNKLQKEYKKQGYNRVIYSFNILL
jgi:hypothetical protein